MPAINRTPPLGEKALRGLERYAGLNGPDALSADALLEELEAARKWLAATRKHRQRLAARETGIVAVRTKQ